MAGTVFGATAGDVTGVLLMLWIVLLLTLMSWNNGMTIGNKGVSALTPFLGGCGNIGGSDSKPRASMVVLRIDKSVVHFEFIWF